MEATQINSKSPREGRTITTQFNEAMDSPLASDLEKEALADTILTDNHPESPASQDKNIRSNAASGIFRASDTSLNTLATLLILCTAYISSRNSRSLLICLEQAFILAKKLWEELASNQEFIFLIQWLGYIHTTAMLSPGNYTLKAPDFLALTPNETNTIVGATSVSDIVLSSQMALETSQTDTEMHSQLLEKASVKKLHQEFRSSCFDDITTTTGISNTVAGLLYNIGRLSRLRAMILESEEPAENHWFWGDFEAELDGLEIQLDQITRRRNMRTQIFETSVHRLSLLGDEYKDEDLSQTIDLNRYNDALVRLEMKWMALDNAFDTYTENEEQLCLLY
ncbi:hypothetical protein G7Z17_g419 [Cylindrodendrum hubeiense]|uniref:Uncharacterized protein n=1 Tax=Cylindrodendrum hubeiense TaxID=595255 RepID=A0A9P5HS44_9HYPO|nr:hypothetical protein G7Z17_g419 [Cylindrodendrum hubeiense]